MPEVKEGKRQKCKQCGHDWLPRGLKVYRCPRCQSFRWDEADE